MAPAEIPGFYFDPDKKKYFKVVANHELGKGARYSKDSVKKAEEKQRKDKVNAATAAKVRQQRVRRARILQHASVPTTCLNRELGSSSGNRRCTIAGLKALLSAFSLDVYNCFPSRFRQDGTITALMQENASKTILFGWSCGDEWQSENTLWSLRRVSSTSTTAGPVQSQLDLLSAEYSAISSISILSHPQFVVTGSLGDFANPVISTFPIDQNQDFASSLSDSNWTRRAINNGPTGSTTLWTSACSSSCLRFSTNTKDELFGPDSADVQMIAYGTSRGLHLLAQDHLDSGLVEAHSLPRSDIWACEWQSPSVIAAGYRNAEVWLYDVRVGEGVLRLRHGGAVTGIKRAKDQSQMVVCGLNDSLCLYDLRFTTAPQHHRGRNARPTKRQRRNNQHAFAHPSSRSLVTLPYLNSYIHPIGFDVHSPTGLVAAAEDTGMIQIYSLLTGTKLASHQAPQSEKYPRDGQWARNLSFIDSEEKVGGPRLLGSAGREIFEIGW